MSPDPAHDPEVPEPMRQHLSRRELLRWTSAGVASMVAGAGAQAATPDLSAPPVRLFNNNGSDNPARWTRIVGTPANLDPARIVLDNGRIRLMHPPSEPTEKAGHVMFINFRGAYRRVGDPDYGDWSYCGSSFTDPCTGVIILENNDNCVRVRLRYDLHRNEYFNNEPMPVQKSIVLHRGSWGYRAVFDTNDLPGEREVGFGGTESHLFCYSNSEAILWNPDTPPPAATTDGTDYVWIRDDEQQLGDWWGVGLAFDLSFYRLVAVRPPVLPGIRTGQFSGGNTAHLIHWSFQPTRRYEAFVAAVPYDGTQARNIVVSGGIARVNVPRDGVYSLYSRTSSGRRDEYVVAQRGLRLRVGWNNINVRNLILNAPVIAPVANGVNLPHDLFVQYYNRRWD